MLLRSPTYLFEPWCVHSGDAFLLVHALIVADLAEQIGHRVKNAVLLREVRVKRFCLPFGTVRDPLHVLVLGVVFEVRVESIAPR